MNEIKTCLFCNEQARYTGIGSINQKFEIDCPNCSKFMVTSDLMQFFNFKELGDKKYLLSGLIREKNEFGLKLNIIEYDTINNYFNDSFIPKSFFQKVDKVLLYLYRKTPFFGATIEINEKTPYSIGYAHNSLEFSKIIDVLIEQRLLEKMVAGGNIKVVGLNANGIKRAEELTETNIHSNTVFVAMGFKTDLLEAHQKAVIPACKECGFDATIVSDIAHNNDINDQIISSIKSSKFVIVDLTYNNQGAYFEAGFAQGYGLEVIRSCKKKWFDEKDEHGHDKNHLHFDVNHYNFILWESAEDFKEQLIYRIKATILA